MNDIQIIKRIRNKKFTTIRYLYKVYNNALWKWSDAFT